MFAQETVSAKLLKKLFCDLSCWSECKRNVPTCILHSFSSLFVLLSCEVNIFALLRNLKKVRIVVSSWQGTNRTLFYIYSRNVEAVLSTLRPFYFLSLLWLWITFIKATSFVPFNTVQGLSTIVRRMRTSLMHNVLANDNGNNDNKSIFLSL